MRVTVTIDIPGQSVPYATASMNAYWRGAAGEYVGVYYADPLLPYETTVVYAADQQERTPSPPPANMPAWMTTGWFDWSAALGKRIVAGWTLRFDDGSEVDLTPYQMRALLTAGQRVGWMVERDEIELPDMGARAFASTPPANRGEGRR